MNQEMLYTVPEVAQLLKMNKGSVYTLINSGVLTALKLGSLKVTRYELLRFLKQYNGMDLTDLSNIKPLKR